MNRTMYSNVSVLGFTLTLPLIAIISAAALPIGMSALTLVALSTLAIGTTVVIYSTWRNAQPTQIIGHVLREAEARSPASVRPARDRRIGLQRP